MTTPAPLRLLAATNNQRGDLFTRLTSDMFYALSYDGLRFDVHKSGREVDIQGTHRQLPRRLVAECKAHTDKMGGAELNKFFGVVSRERSKDKTTPVDGYFVSLNGFRETGVEQELETDPQDRMILLDGQQAIDELIRIRILVNRENATEKAGRCAEQSGLTDAELDGAEVLGHELGYLWAVYYSQNKQRTHFALIHADGTPLADAIAQKVIQDDRNCEGSLHTLAYLPPPVPAADRQAIAQAAVARYREWVVNECGDIQMDGLPADANLAAYSMRLERVFVPLRVKVDPAPDDHVDLELTLRDTEFTVGEFLKDKCRVSLLAKPGGGKSTLLKRLAVAYADPARRKETDDGLPDRDWLPLLLKCRDLRDRAHRPILELLADLALQASLNRDQQPLFAAQIDDALRFGRALLLIDGLDEISDEGARSTFAGHLRSFLAMFPNVAMVVTSREAGYRLVAGVVASTCEQVRLAPFDAADVTRLCESWHAVVVNDSDSVRDDSRQLAATIWNNERIRSLAENPLMLTTLLVVRRWMGGELPTKRVELYREAVKVLIYTWNVEGYAKMDLDETLAQLSYVAWVMMDEGLQQIGHRQLLKLLQQARDEMQAELQFTKISPANFIKRVEYRSSLLMQTGHERINGELQPVYEFRHLTFQEYLAARGLTEEQYPGRDEGKTLVELLEPHFEDERWREVIPLAAVLAGRKAEPLIQRLTSVCESRKLDRGYPRRVDVTAPPVVLLRRCLLDEVQVKPLTLRAALRQIGRHGSETILKGSVIELRRGRFGEVFQEVVETEFLENASGWDEFAFAMSDLALETLFPLQVRDVTQGSTETLDLWFRSEDRLHQIRAALAWEKLIFLNRNTDKRDFLISYAQPFRDMLGQMVVAPDSQRALAGSWALVWTGTARLPDAPPSPEILLALFSLWREAPSGEVRRFAAWAFREQPLVPRDSFPIENWGDCDCWLERCSNGDEYGQEAALVLAWYRRQPWSDAELVGKILQRKQAWNGPTVHQLLIALGEPVDSN